MLCELKLTESQAILRYICNEWAPDMVGRTVTDKSRVDMVIGVASDIRQVISEASYKTGDRENATKAVLARGERLADFLAKRSFVAGDYLTFADFFLFEIEELAEWISEGKLFEQFPAIKAHHKRVAELPTFATFLKSHRFVSRTFHSIKYAKLNN